jgi:hypothetical protein
MDAKFQKIKTWISDHSTELMVTSVYGGALALVGGISYLAYKSEAAAVAAYNDQRAETLTWIESKENGGQNVYGLSNGGLLAIPKDTEIEVKLT